MPWKGGLASQAGGDTSLPTLSTYLPPLIIAHTPLPVIVPLINDFIVVVSDNFFIIAF